jgi:hypothetical protein
MPSPFPGMDPYLETSDRWRNVHGNLATEIQTQLAPLIRPRYYADQEPRFVYDIGLDVVTRHQALPDVSVVEHPRPTTVSHDAVAIAPAPLEVLITTDLPEKLTRVVIRTVEGDTLVTAIEILSFANKRPGHAAYLTYRRKRRAILASTAHLLEIDLLRAGERSPLAEPLPEAPYFIILSRAERRPVAEVWPLHLQEPLPILPVPLLPPDPDVPLDLGHALRTIYDRSGYDLRIDYTQRPPAPALSTEEGAWLEAHLRTAGKRHSALQGG